MYNTLELGAAGTNEWLAASADMTLLSEPYYELTCSNLNQAFDSLTASGYDSGQTMTGESTSVFVVR
jgi:hypothetical protein